MKKSVIFLAFNLLIIFAFGQFAQENPDQKYSGFSNQKKLGFQGYKQSSLLQDYDVHFYFLDIAMERTSTYVSGNVTIVSTVTAASLDTFALELIDALTVDSVFIDGVQKSFSHTTDHIYIPVGTPISAGASINTKVYYHGNPPVGGFFSGISNDSSPSWGNQVTWTLSEPFNANQWWPCKQVLPDKADSCWVFITTSNTNMAGSNGLLTATVPVAGNKLRFEWKSNYPIAYYLISAAVAEYVDYTIYAHPAGTTDSVMIQNFVYDNPGTLPYWIDEINMTVDFIELYSDLFGLYPFIGEKYGHSMAPLGGGMEHQTMTTLGTFGFYLVCHELTHMWWGDNVTCATWSDIWVNEGFASYGEYLAAQYLDSYAEAQLHMDDVHSNVMSQPDGSIYIPPAETNDENRIFDGRLSYDKGSAIIHMLRFEMQDDSLFFLTLKTFQDEFTDSVATGLDFKGVAESVSGLNLTDFFDQWYFGEGYPSFYISWYKLGDTLYFTSTQTTSAGVTPLFKMLMEYKVKWTGGDTLIRVYQTDNFNSYAVYVPHSVTGMEVDPENWVLNGPGSVVASVTDVREALFFQAVPNPCHDQLRIYIPNSDVIDARYAISDITGKRILEGVTTTETRLDVTGLLPGLYFITLSNNEGYSTMRFVKW